ncbi:hypothetical protein H4Q26_006457 [Puccinia striiformis f. sp. tritici PST-130]|nr:hypothetical protein H4Q26_006457 [Puccinia striiformis f. sp. tritici PST-130]
MKRPDNFDGSSPAKLRNFLQQCKLIFRNNLDAFSSDLKKTLYALAFLTGKAFEHDQLTNFQKANVSVPVQVNMAPNVNQ